MCWLKALLCCKSPNDGPLYFRARTGGDSPYRSVAQLKSVFDSGQPREVAWAAFDVARQNRQELVPDLVSLVSLYERGSAKDEIAVLPEDAAIEAVADTLIQLQVKLPASTIMHLYPKFPAPTVILLARANDNTASLLKVFQTAHCWDLWLAAGNLLVARPPPEFVRSLLDGLIVAFRFRVVAPRSKLQ